MIRLERFHENGYRDSYSLRNSFQGRQAPIYCLAGRAGPSIAETPTPVVQAMKATRILVIAIARVAKSWQEVNVMTVNAYREKNMLYIKAI